MIFDSIDKKDLNIIKRYCDQNQSVAKVELSDDYYTVYLEKEGRMTWYATDQDLGYAAFSLAKVLNYETNKGEHLLYRPHSLLNK